MQELTWVENKSGVFHTKAIVTFAAIVLALLPIVGVSASEPQQAGATSEKNPGDTWTLTAITLKDGSPKPLTGEYFRWESQLSADKGEKIGAALSLDYKRGFSIVSKKILIGKTERQLPSIRFIEREKGLYHFFFLSNLSVLKDIAAGKVIKDGIYIIQANRKLTSGEVLGAYGVLEEDVDTIFAIEGVATTDKVVSGEIPAVVITKRASALSGTTDSSIQKLWIEVRDGIPAGSIK